MTRDATRSSLRWNVTQAKICACFNYYFQKLGMCYYRKKSWPTNSFVNKRKIVVHLTYAKNDNLSIRVYINTNQDWFLFSIN